MSKTHIADGQTDDLDALLDEYQKTHQTKPIAKNNATGITFNDVPEKKKNLLQRLLAKLKRLLLVDLQI